MSDGIQYTSSSLKVTCGNNIITFSSSSVSGSNIEADLALVRNNVTVISGTTTLTSEMSKILINNVSQSMTISFPSAALNKDKKYVIKYATSFEYNSDIIQNDNTVTLNASTPYNIPIGTTMIAISDGSTWSLCWKKKYF